MTIRLLYVDRSVHQAWPVARELELGRPCQESVTVAEVIMMGATCIGLVEEVDALGGDVLVPVERRPDIKVIERWMPWVVRLRGGLVCRNAGMQ